MCLCVLCVRESGREGNQTIINSIYKFSLRSFFFKNSLLFLSLSLTYIIHIYISWFKWLHVSIMEANTFFFFFLHMFLYWSQYGIFYRQSLRKRKKKQKPWFYSLLSLLLIDIKKSHTHAHTHTSKMSN